MRKLAIALATVAVLALVNVGIAHRASQVASGTPVVLELQPVDPRALMQGDYMRLSYRIVRDAFPDRVAIPAYGDGRLVVAPDARGVARFVRFDDGAPLAAGEVRLRYRVRDGDVRFATNAWFFEEGHGADFAPARYGEFRVAPDGEMLLVKLRDKDLAELAHAAR
jgi:uncharacterized membrane-anchored protein